MSEHQAGALRQEAVEDGLPPLPEPIRRQGQQMSYDDCDTVHFDCYTADQMQAYARQAVATLRAERDAARAALADIAAMTFDPWTNGARAGEIARAAITATKETKL